MDHILGLDANPIFGCIVLYLARHAAGFTSDTSFLVDDILKYLRDSAPLMAEIG